MNRNKCVVLNSTFEPLSVVSARRGLILCLQNKATALQKYDYKIRSESMELSLPSTIALNTYIKTKKLYNKKAALNNRNLFIRDDHTCQYCERTSSELSSKEKLTKDHVVPKTRNGPHAWENVVASCSTCNNKKSDLTLEQIGFILKKEPYAPSVIEIFVKSKIKHFDLNKLYDEVLCST